MLVQTLHRISIVWYLYYGPLKRTQHAKIFAKAYPFEQTIGNSSQMTSIPIYSIRAIVFMVIFLCRYGI